MHSAALARKAPPRTAGKARPGGTPAKKAQPTKSQPKPGVARAAGPRARTGVILLVWGTTMAALVVGVLLVMAKAGTPAEAGAIVLPGSQLSVSTVTAEVMSHSTDLPVAQMPDMPAAGYRRVSVQFAVRGTSGGGTYDAGALRLSGAGLPAAVAPIRTESGTGTLSDGERVTGTALFEVPEDARAAELAVPGADGSISLPLPRFGSTTVSAGHDHSTHTH